MTTRAGTTRGSRPAQGLDRQSALALVRRMCREDATVAPAVARQSEQIARAVDVIAHRLRNGGRLLYVGAGSSGRIAALDAAECPPTFGTPPSLVQAVVAGGRAAISRAVEAAEDAAAQGRRDLAAKKLTARDVVVGISASGTTPYVLAALEYARRKRSPVISVASQPHSPIAKIADIAIVADTGPEVIAGSTRLKAGTAQKMILNMLSTGAMIRLGRVYDHWMIDVSLSSAKLRKRGLRILEEAGGVTNAEAARALSEARNDLRTALVMLRLGVTAGQARERLRSEEGELRRALNE